MNIQKQVPLAPYTTLGIGGPADYFLEVHSLRDIEKAVTWAKKEDVSITVLGGGSNVLISDEGVRGLVVYNKITDQEWREDGTDVFLTVGAGAVFDEVVSEAVEKGLWGLENLSAIPGSVGATPVQNIGAYGVEIQDRIVEVKVCHKETGEVETLPKEACAFGYRDSLFKHEAGEKYIITHVTYCLSKEAQPVLTYKDVKNYFKDSAHPSLSEVRDAICGIRSKKFPDWNEVGTAGSFFKNPIISREQYEVLKEQYPDMPSYYVAGTERVKIPLGYVLDKILSMRGVEDGLVGTYQEQALVLIAKKGSTAQDITQFAKAIEKKVFDATSITIEWEVTFLS